jgi:hypothetical protein
MAVAALGAAAPAALAVGWTTPAALPASQTGSNIETVNARLSVNAAGAQVITWDDYVRGADSFTCATGEARTRVPGGEWSPTTEIGCGAKVQMGPDSTALALWENSSGELDAATAAAGSSFGTAKVVEAQPSGGFSSVVATLDTQGRATVAWHTYAPVPGSAQFDLFAKTQNADGTWPTAHQTVDIGGTGTSIVDSNGYYGLAIAAGAHDDVVIAADILYPASSPSASDKAVVTYNRLTPTGGWVRRVLTAGTNLYLRVPIIATDPQDRVLVMDALQSLGGTYELYGWTRAADTTTWPASAEIVGTASNTVGYVEPAAALDSAGNAQTAFSYPTSSGGFDIHAASRGPGQTNWVADTPSQLNPIACNDGTGTTPSVAFDSTNVAAVSFDCNQVPYMFTRPAGTTVFSSFTPPAGQAVQISTDPNGYLIATWTSGGVTYTSVYDAVPPSVDGVTPPTNPVAGQPATFTVSGSDVWGPVTYSVDFGDGSAPATGRAVTSGGSAAFAGAGSALFARALGGGTVSHTYASPGAYTATIRVNDNAGNSATSTTPVAVAAATPGVTPLDTPLPPVIIPGLPDPVAGVSANVAPIKQPVRIKAPGAKRFIPLTVPAQIKIGSIIDATLGRVRITIADGLGRLDTADFYAGVFKMTQPKVKRGQRWFANLLLSGGNFKGCPRAPRHPRIAALSRKKSPKRSVRHLWGAGKGAFRTVGRYSSATIRGTTWLTDDKCNGTLTRVKVGKVAVRDFVKRKTIVVRAPKTYFARAKKR